VRLALPDSHSCTWRCSVKPFSNLKSRTLRVKKKTQGTCAELFLSFSPRSLTPLKSSFE